MTDLTEARAQIREVDLEMRELFLKRMEAATAVAAWKKERGFPVEDREQEERILSELSPQVEDEKLRELYQKYQQTMMDLSKEWQQYLIDNAAE